MNYVLIKKLEIKNYVESIGMQNITLIKYPLYYYNNIIFKISLLKSKIIFDYNKYKLWF